MQQPPAQVLFSNTAGGSLSCYAEGQPPPTLTWVLSDGSTLRDIPSLQNINTQFTRGLLLDTTRQEETDSRTSGNIQGSYFSSYAAGHTNYFSGYPTSSVFENLPTHHSYEGHTNHNYGEEAVQEQVAGGYNSTLTLTPFRPDQYRHAVHVNTYR